MVIIMKKVAQKVLGILVALCAIVPFLPTTAHAALDNRVERAISWAVSVANDNSHGYSMVNRNGPDYDCSSFVSTAFKQGGFNISGSNWTGSMEQAFTSVGFKAYAAGSVTLQRGDILLRHDNVQQHVELYLGNNQCVAAHWDDDGKAGDGTGHEIEVRSKAYCDFCNYKQYTRVLRYENSSVKPSLSFSPSSLSMNVGETKSVTIKFAGDGIQSIGGSINGQSLLSAKWGNTEWSTGTTSLTITGKKAGTATITVKLMDKNGKTICSKSLTVTIKEKTSTIADGVYVIQAGIGNNMVLDCEKGNQTDGSRVLLWNRHNAENQQIRVIQLENGNYVLQFVHSGKVLDVANASMQSGAKVIQWTWNGGLNQQWKLIDAGDGYYYIVSALSGMTLDVSGGNAKAGSEIIVYQSHGGNNQKFRFLPIG